MFHTHAGLWTLVVGIVLLSGTSEGLRGSALVAELKAKAKAALLNPTETVVEEVVTVEGEQGGNATNVTVTKTKSLLTGNPQKDYIYDPNLPRELNGYNLTNYPFYNGVPEDIDFKCDDLHDGFYASVPHKCQVYHHCLFGTRYDFLCANYTAFDQRTFICHFVSEVDCDNSPKFYQRNEALYKAASTSAPITIPQTTTTTPAPTAAPTSRPRRRRPYRRRRPVYEYYYDDQYDDEEYYDDDPPPPRRKMNRKHRPQGGFREEEDDYYDGRRGESSRGDSSRAESSRGDSRGEGSRGEGGGDSSKELKPTLRISGPASGTVYDRPRVPPKIRRPVPINERDKYDYTQKTSDGGPPPTQDPKKNVKPTSKVEEDEEEYYDEEYEDDYVKPPPKRGKTGSDYGSESGGKTESRRGNGRHRPRQHSRRRPDRYEDDYEEDRPARPRKRPRYEDPPPMSRSNRGSHRGYSRDEPEPADRPGFISNGRFSSGSRKRTDDDRSTTTTKKPPPRVVYDDEEEEEEYYDDEEEDVHEDESSRSNHKTSSKTGNGRRTDDYEAESGRKHSNRKQSGETYPPKSTSKSGSRYQPTGNYNGEPAKNENGKSANRQRPESTPFTRSSVEEQCKHDCEEDYSDETVYNSKEENRKESEKDSQKQTREKDIQKQVSERDRLFSSRFRETQNESKLKSQSSDSAGPQRPSSSLPNYRTTTQSPEPPPRPKSTPRVKTAPVQDEPPVTPKSTTTTSTTTTTTTTTTSPLDYSDESSTSSVKYSNFRSKGRGVVPPTPLINNYKMISTTEETYEPAEISESEPEEGPDSYESVEQSDSSSDRSIPQRPYSGIARRPVKPAPEPVPFEEPSVQQQQQQPQQQPPVPPKTPAVGLNYRQPSVLTEDDEKAVRKSIVSGQPYRRVKPDYSQVESGEYNQQKMSNIGNNFRRPSKPVEETRPEEASYADVQEEPQSPEENQRKENKPFYLDKPQSGNAGFGGAYRRVKVSAISTPAPEPEISTYMYETPHPYQGAPVSTPVNYKRPYLVSRPLSNNPVIVEDTTKNTLLLNGAYRRPSKQKIQDAETPLTGDEYSPAPPGSAGDNSYRKPEPSLGVNLRPTLGYFPPKRGKIRIDDNSGRGIEQYPKQLTLNQETQFSKQSPKIEITAPGPSAPDVDIATVKSNYKNEYSNAPPGFTLDIPEEEYDVTLNDALQPSTLHPTRSLIDYQQTRLKTRDYQTNIGRSPEYVNRGRVSYLLPAASQQYITRVQSVYTPPKQEETPITARYTDKTDKKDPEEYEAVVLTAPSDQWPNQRRNRPTEWYW